MKKVKNVIGFLVFLISLNDSVRAEEARPGGRVDFQGVMLGASACTLETAAPALDMGNIYPMLLPQNAISHWEPVVFRMKDCNPQTHHVSMTVNYQKPVTDWGDERHLISSHGTGSGILAALAPQCAEGHYQSCIQSEYDRTGMASGTTLAADVTAGEATFPLKVGLAHPTHFNTVKPGTLESVVNFSFSFD